MTYLEVWQQHSSPEDSGRGGGLFTAPTVGPLGTRGQDQGGQDGVGDPEEQGGIQGPEGLPRLQTLSSQQHGYPDGGPEGLREDPEDDGDHDAADGQLDCRRGGSERGTPTQEGLRQHGQLLDDVRCPDSTPAVDETARQQGDSGSGGTLGMMVQSDGPFHKLSPSQARFLEKESHMLGPRTWEDLVRNSRTLLIEVACSPTSVLSETVQSLAGYPEAAIRCAHWNGCDLETWAGVQQVLKLLKQHRPQHVWISPGDQPANSTAAI